MIKFLPAYCFITVESLLFWFLIFFPAFAEVIPDNTLPDSSRVTPQGNTRVIEGGTRRGGNLFHSFQEFSIPVDGIASFRGVSAEIVRLFARVTGSTRSVIEGAIEVLQSNGSVSPADVFLLNPNGIIFGQNASLNIGGSFIATTADRILYADGTEFSAVNPEASSLLTVSVPVGLQFGHSPGEIVNRSITPLVDSTGNPILNEQGETTFGGLQVRPGATLALLGGDVTLPGGNVTVEGGRIEVGSVASAGSVGLTHTNEWRVTYAAVPQFGSIQLSDFAVLNTSGVGGGAIQIQGDRILIAGESLVLADTLGSQNGRGITIHASQLTLDEFSLIGASALGPGAGGTVQISTDQLLVQDGALIDVGSPSGGPGGRLEVTSTDSIDLIGGRFDSSSSIASGFFARTSGASEGGNISITTNRLSLREGAQIVASSRGTGNAGTITIDANQIELDGVGRLSNGEPLIREDLGGIPGAPSGLITAGSSGNGNTITIATQQLQVSNGAVIQSSTQGAGNAGDLQIAATESIELIGIPGEPLFVTGLLAFSGGIASIRDFGNVDATGRGGNLNVVTPELIIRDGAVAATGSLNPTREAAGAGNIRIQGEQVRLDNRGRVVAATASGDGGDITIAVQDQVVLRHNSEISTTAGSAGAGGNGGNIQINAGFVVAVPSEDSDITANAFTGNGGNVNIVTQALLGIAPRDRLTPESDITATSEQGVVGNVTIRSPDLDPRLGLAELPDAPINTELAQGCQPTGGQATAAFFNQGRGGIPPTPDEPLSNTALLEDVRLPIESSAGLDASSDVPLVEAEGWIVDGQGTIALVAEVSPVGSTGCYLR